MLIDRLAGENMFGLSVEVPQFGRLRRGWGKWCAPLAIPQFEQPVDLWIEIRRDEPLEAFVEQATNFARRFEQLSAAFAGELFESYMFYKRTDLEEGAYIAADFAKHPSVTSPADVWHVLRPFRLRLGPMLGKHFGNSYLLIDVDWPNPHFFQMFMKASPSGFEYVHTEFVG
jgi:hypothetical protein